MTDDAYESMDQSNPRSMDSPLHGSESTAFHIWLLITVVLNGTFGDGISHTGVYIGDGQFVHAENEGTDVTISWLWSDYYAAHYYGATRLW